MELGIGISDCDWGLGLRWGIGIGIAGFGITIGDWECGLDTMMIGSRVWNFEIQI